LFAGCAALLCRYLSFVKGIVDSSDLPLNVSREILQESRIVRVIRKQLIRRSIEMIEGLAKKEGGEDYKTFWENFGRNLKVRCARCVLFTAQHSKLSRRCVQHGDDVVLAQSQDDLCLMC
jgi:HSP90 family molecular chaperone